MSESHADLRPSTVFGMTTGALIAGLVIVPIMAIPGLLFLTQAPGDAFTYGLFGVLSFVLFKAQNQAEIALDGRLSDSEEDTESERELSTLQKAIGVVLTFLQYNLLVMVSAILGTVVAGAYSQTVALFALVAYGAWDIYSQKYAIPLSAGGFVVFSLVIGLLITHSGRAIISILRKTDLRRILRAFSEESPTALLILHTPERKPVLFARDCLKRVDDSRRRLSR